MRERQCLSAERLVCLWMLVPWLASFSISTLTLWNCANVLTCWKLWVVGVVSWDSGIFVSAAETSQGWLLHLQYNTALPAFQVDFARFLRHLTSSQHTGVVPFLKSNALSKKEVLYMLFICRLYFLPLALRPTPFILRLYTRSSGRLAPVLSPFQTTEFHWFFSLTEICSFP